MRNRGLKKLKRQLNIPKEWPVEFIYGAKHIKVVFAGRLLKTLSKGIGKLDACMARALRRELAAEMNL